MVEEDDDNCSLCESECTCPSGVYRAKGKGRSLPAGKGKCSAMLAMKRQPCPSASPSAVSSPSSRRSLTPTLPTSPKLSAKPLKIKLTLGQRPQPTTSTTQSSSAHQHPPNGRPRSVDYTTSESDSESMRDTRSVFSKVPPSKASKPSPDPPPIPTSSRFAGKNSKATMKSLLPSTGSSRLPKRRGRPPKAVIAAREAAARAEVQAHGVFKEAMFDRPIRASASAGGSTHSNYHASTLPVGSSSKVRADIPKSQAVIQALSKPEPRPHYPTSAFPTNARTQSKPSVSYARSKAHRQKSSSGPTKQTSTVKKSASHATPTRKNAATTNSRKRRRDTPSPSPPPEEDSSSDDSTHTSDEELIFPEDLQSSRTSAYATFISASSSSSSSSSLSDECGEDDSEIDVGDDIDLKREEERMLMEQESQRQRGKRNRGPNQGRGRHQQRESKKDSSSGHSNGSSASSSDDEDDEDDDADDDENDADNLDVIAASDPPEWEGVGGWTDSDEDIDADLFFANFLSDSSSSEETGAPSAGQQEADADGDEESFASDGDDDMEGVGSGERGRKVLDQFFGSTSFMAPPRTTRLSARVNNLTRQPLPQSRKRKRTSGAVKRKARPPLMITEDSDGQLIFTDGFRAGEGVVDMDFEQRRLEMRKLLGDDYDSSNESEGLVMSGVEESGHAPIVAPDESESAAGVGKEGQEPGTETETDFTGESTVDEGLDEDGMPPPRFPSEHHKERYNYSGSGGFNLDNSDFDITQREDGRLQPYLLPGVELFQNRGGGTVMFGRFDFPASQPPFHHSPNNSKSSDFTISPRKRSASAPHLESPTFTLSPTILQTTDPFSERLGDHPLALSTPALATSPVTSPTPADILSGRWRRDSHERRASMTLESAAMAQEATELGSPHLTLLPPISLEQDANRQVVSTPQALKEDPRTPPPPSPPRNLPTMGTFTIPIPLSSPPQLLMEAVQIETVAPTTSSPSRQRPRSFSAATPGSQLTSSKSFAFPRPKCIAVINDRGGAIIGGVTHNTIPSPFANVKRRRKLRHLSSGVDGSESSVSAISGGYRRSISHARHSSFAGSVYSSYSQSFTGQSLSTPVFESESFISSPPGLHDSQVSIGQSLFHPPGPLSPTGQVPFPPSVELADVLDSSFLDEDITMSPTSTHEDDHVRSISRWDRVPMGTFRRSRALSNVGSSSDHPAGHQASPSTNIVSDGFSYGSQSRISIPESVLQSTLWSEGAVGRVTKNVKGKGKAVTPRAGNKMRHRRMAISPVIFPVRGGSPVGELELDGDGDVGMGTGVEEEEGYFSRRTSKGGREGSLRGKKLDKASKPPTKKARLASIMEVVSSTPHST